MVSVTHAISQGDTAPPIALLAAGLASTERVRIEAALEWIAKLYEGKVLGTGEPTWTHAIGAALIAASLRLDAETRIAALLFAVWDELDDPAVELDARFGPAITTLVRGLHRLTGLRVLTHHTNKRIKHFNKCIFLSLNTHNTPRTFVTS